MDVAGKLLTFTFTFTPGQHLGGGGELPLQDSVDWKGLLSAAVWLGVDAWDRFALSGATTPRQSLH